MPWYSNQASPAHASQEQKEIDIPILGKIASNKLALDYLTNRHITQLTVKQLGLADWVEQRRVFIPFVGGNGDVIGYTGRDYSGTSACKYRNSIGAKALYVPDRTAGTGVAEDSARIIVVEGPMDAIACYQAGVNDCRAVALGGKWASGACADELRRLCAARVVLIWLDPDARAEASKLARQLAPHVASVKCWHDTCYKDAAEVPPAELARILQEAYGTGND